MGKREKPNITSPGGKVKGHESVQSAEIPLLGNCQKGPYSHNLLGWCVAKRMGLVMRVDGIDTVMLSDVFGDIGLLKCDPVKIELKADAILCQHHAISPFPFFQKLKLNCSACWPWA